MPRRKRFKVPGPKEACRDRSCPLYGKLMYRLDLRLHVLKEHKLNMASHDLLPHCSSSGFSKKTDMKYRQARQCYHPYCPKQGSFFGRFDKHLRTTHNLTVEQYDTLMELYEEQRSYLRKHPLDKSSKLENFCPTMEEIHPNHPIDPQTVKDKIDVKGNKTYPKRRLRTFSVVADNIKIFNTYQHGREDVEVHAADPKTKEQLILHFDTRKLVISKEHETILWNQYFGRLKINPYCNLDRIMCVILEKNQLPGYQGSIILNQL
ncbi:uncharacterized protein [Amphiura filiformis]|uniref:uncharacterized protein n=1 Tax=Amphiura filiformis TaxID=82378 RepID=UPI003B226EED